MCAPLAAGRKKKSTGRKSGKSRKKTKGKSGSANKKAESLRRGINFFLGTILVLMILAGAGWMWAFLGKPGWPERVPEDRSACVELYFYDSAVAYLVPIHRRVDLAPNDTITGRAVHEFAIGPRDPNLARVYPANIPIPSVQITGDTALVDLPGEILGHMGGASKEAALLDSLTMTVAAAGECSRCRILIAGEPMEATGEGYILDEPLEPPEYINQVSNSLLEGESRWVTVYYVREVAREYLFPLTLEVPLGTPIAEAAVKAMLETPPRVIYPPPIRICPEGYSLERLRIENSVAHVDIRVPDPQTAFMNYDINIFRRALYLTLKKCCDVTDVELSFNGRLITSYERFGFLPALSAETCWNMEFVPVQTGSTGEQTVPLEEGV